VAIEALARSEDREGSWVCKAAPDETEGAFKESAVGAATSETEGGLVSMGEMSTNWSATTTDADPGDGSAPGELGWDMVPVTGGKPPDQQGMYKT